MSDAPVKVLLVDDDEDDYIITRDLILRIAGRYHLDWVNNFPAALDAIQRREHDIYLLDYCLGERTGLSVVPIATIQRRVTHGSDGQGDHEIQLRSHKGRRR